MEGNGCAGCLLILILAALFVPVIFLFVILSVIAIIIANIVSKKEDEKLAKEKEEIRKQKESEERKKRQKNCLICSLNTEGDTICDTCKERSVILSKEIRSNKYLNYEKLITKRKHYMQDALTASTTFSRTESFIQIISCDNILSQKYKNRTLDHSIIFFKDINNNLNKTEIIKKYGLDYYTTESREFKCLDGHVVKSKAEREIDNFFFSNGIKHVYETKYVHPVTKKTASTDFFIPEKNLYIEYFGLSDPEYIRRKKEKIEMYSSDRSINFEYLTGDDDGDIYEKLLQICAKYSIKTKS